MDVEAMRRERQMSVFVKEMDDGGKEKEVGDV